MRFLRRAFRPLRRMGWALFLSFAYLIATWLLLPGHEGDTEKILQLRNNLTTNAGDYLGVIWCLSGLWTVRRQFKNRQGSYRFPWATVALALACFCLGVADSIWAWLEWKALEPFPSAADYFSLTVIPCVLMAVLLLPAHRLPSSQRMRILLDGLVGLSAMFTFSWHFFITHAILDDRKVGVLAKAVGIAYPIGDLLLASCLLILLLRAGRSLRGAGLTYIALGIIALLTVDSIFLYQTLNGTYQSGTPLDLLWSLSSLCLGLGGRSLALRTATYRFRVLARSGEEPLFSSPLRAALPYLLVPFSGIFFFSTLLEHQEQSLEMIGMWISGALMVCFILLRQFVAIQDNWWLVHQSQQDAEALKSLNQELRAAQAELVHSAKMASLGTLSAGVAHELNQPIAIIRGLAQQLQDEPNLSPYITEDLKLIEQQTGRMMRIIAQLRSFCRTDGHEVSTIALGALVDNCLVLLGAQLKSRGVAVSIATPLEPLEVLANANEVEQILLNLITNARDAVEGLKNPQIELRLAASDEFIVLECADNGPGIAPEALPHLFEPFFTTKEVGKGMGLGLSISENLAKKNGGSLTARTEHGAIFTLKLPRVQAAVLPNLPVVDDAEETALPVAA